jgi:DNA-binding NarL/FixJ family response regulator
VLDIQLSGMSGIELGQRLMAEGGHTPVIYMTAHDDPEARAGAESAGCAAYFRKTDSAAEVLEANRRLVAESPATPTVGRQSFTTAAVRRFCSRIWRDSVLKIDATAVKV